MARSENVSTKSDNGVNAGSENMNLLAHTLSHQRTILTRLSGYIEIYNCCMPTS